MNMTRISNCFEGEEGRAVGAVGLQLADCVSL